MDVFVVEDDVIPVATADVCVVAVVVDAGGVGGDCSGIGPPIVEIFPASLSTFLLLVFLETDRCSNDDIQKT